MCITGMNPSEVAIHFPQLQPPPASGERTIPPAGTVLSQQPGRSRSQLGLTDPVWSQTVTLLSRKINELVVAA